MAQLDALRKYLEAGMAFTQTTRARAEEIVGNLVRAGELQTEQTQQQVQDLVDRSRENTERLVKVVRTEVIGQLGSLGLATKADLAKLERKLDAAVRASKPGAAKKTGQSDKKATAKKATAKKATAKKSDGQEERRQEVGHQEGGCVQGVTKARRRLDAELLRRGLAETREAAQQLVVSGQVTVGGAPADKSSRLVAADEPIVVLAPPPRFVSRGGEKLAAALERFGVDVARGHRSRRRRVDRGLQRLLVAGRRRPSGGRRRRPWAAASTDP